jgi:hypothetical protein
MDPNSARLVLDLQLQDVDNVLTSTNGGPETAAFRILQAELLQKRDEIDGQCVAMGMLCREHLERGVHQRLLAEERQARGKWFYSSIL